MNNLIFDFCCKYNWVSSDGIKYHECYEYIVLGLLILVEVLSYMGLFGYAE